VRTKSSEIIEAAVGVTVYWSRVEREAQAASVNGTTLDAPGPVTRHFYVRASSAFCLSSGSMANAPDLLYSEASFGIAFRCEYEK
jgi:hypothetical protein